MTTRFPHFDGLRAIAALSVVGFHTAFYSHADQGDGVGQVLAHLNIGVPVFFVISGFLLYRPFVAARLEDRPGPRVGGFAWRRFLRIVPVYWVILTIVAIWPGVFGLFTGDWPVYYGFAQVYSTDHVLKGISPAWTLGTEISFYVVLPLYAWVVGRLARRSVRTELLILGGLAALAIGCRTYAQGAAVGGPALLLGLPGTFDWFAVGMAMAILSAAGVEVRLRSGLAWVLAGSLYLVLCFLLGLPKGYVFVQQYSYFQAFAEHLLSGLIAGCLVAPAVFAWHSHALPQRVLAAPVVAWLGLVSYSIYLWHHTVAVELSDRGLDSFVPLTLATVAVTVPLSALTYYLVEKPALRLKGVFGGRRSATPPVSAAAARGEP